MKVENSLMLLLVGIALSVGGASALEVGIDRPGSDLRPGFALPAPDPALCKEECDNEANCRAFTYVRPGYQGRAARCWLKLDVPAAVKNDCCISGVKAIGLRRESASVKVPLSTPQTQSKSFEGAYDQVIDVDPERELTEFLELAKRLDKSVPDTDPRSSVQTTALAALAEQVAPLMSRKETLKSVAELPSVRAALDQVAVSAGTRVDTLLATPTALVPSSGPPPPDSLVEIWQDPVHISPIEPGPMYAVGSKEYAAGVMVVDGVESRPPGCRLSQMTETGAVCLSQRDNHVIAWIDALPGGGPYLISIHVAEMWASKELSSSGISVRVRQGDGAYAEDFSIVPNADGTALVGVFTLPANAQPFEATQILMRAMSMEVILVFERALFFAGVTLIRL